MYIISNKKIVMAMLWICLGISPIALAEETLTAPPPSDDAPLSQAEIEQFQKWLQNSKQAGTVTPPPGASSLTNPPPNPSSAGSSTASSSSVANPPASVVSTPPASVANTPAPPSAAEISAPPRAVKKKPQYVYSPEAPTLVTDDGSYEEAPPPVISPPMSYSKSQQLMLKSAPKSATPPNQDSIDAFNAMMQQNVPLSPQQVVKLRQLIDQSQRAAAIPANVPPKPVSSTLIMNLAPGTTPPAIRLAQGYVTSLVFVDSTGSPWPVSSYDVGNPKTATIQWDQKSNIILIQALAPYGDSDLIVRLAGLPTPLTLELVSGQRVVDYRTDIHVPGIGPNTKDLPVGTPLPGSANQLLLNVLESVAPVGSKQLSVSGGDCLAWLLADKMFLRTRLTVLSPGWTGRMVSPDGMIAYEIPKSSTVLVSQYGQPVELKVEGF